MNINLSLSSSRKSSTDTDSDNIGYSPESFLEFRLPLSMKTSRSLSLEVIQPSFGETVVVGIPGFLAQLPDDFRAHINCATEIDPNYADPTAQHPSEFLGWQEWVCDLVTVLENTFEESPFVTSPGKILFLAESMGIAFSIAAFSELRRKVPEIKADIIAIRPTFMGSERTSKRMAHIYDRGITKLREDDSEKWRARDAYRSIKDKQRLIDLLTIARELNSDRFPLFTQQLDTAIATFPGNILIIPPPLDQSGQPGYDKTHPLEAQECLFNAAKHGSLVPTVQEAFRKLGFSAP